MPDNLAHIFVLFQYFLENVTIVEIVIVLKVYICKCTKGMFKIM